MWLTNVLMFNLTEFLFYAFTKIICYVKHEAKNDGNFSNNESGIEFQRFLYINFLFRKLQMSCTKLLGVFLGVLRLNCLVDKSFIVSSFSNEHLLHLKHSSFHPEYIKTNCFLESNIRTYVQRLTR